MVKNVQALILLAFFILMFSSNASAETDSFPENSVAEIRHPVRVSEGIPPSTTSCNITIYYPSTYPANNSIFVNFKPMGRDGFTSYFNYTLNQSQTTIKGIYPYDITCVAGVLNATVTSEFIINQGGVSPNQQRTDTLSRTIWFFFGLAVFCLISAMFVKRMPVKITLFLFMTWFLLMGINTSLIGMQDEIVNPKIENFFEFFLVLSFLANRFILYGVGVLWIVIFFVTFKDKLNWKKSERYDYG